MTLNVYLEDEPRDEVSGLSVIQAAGEEKAGDDGDERGQDESQCQSSSVCKTGNFSPFQSLESLNITIYIEQSKLIVIK